MHIITTNHGQLVTASTYWGSEYEAAGKLYVSVNAGAIRILLPRTRREVIRECQPARYAILSRGPWPAEGLDDAVEILFEDGSDSPFALHLSPNSFDMLPAEPEAGREWVVSLWLWKKNKPHRAVEKRCYWRRVAELPCLQPWGER